MLIRGAALVPELVLRACVCVVGTARRPRLLDHVAALDVGALRLVVEDGLVVGVEVDADDAPAVEVDPRFDCRDVARLDVGAAFAVGDVLVVARVVVDRNLVIRVELS